GTLTLCTLATLSMPVNGTSTSTFDVTELGVINMYHATITMSTTRVADLDIHVGSPGLANGQLNSLGAVLMGMSMGDTITGSVLNNGSLGFAGSALHTLTVSAAYTQSSSGTLAMRLDVSAASDKL